MFLIARRPRYGRQLPDLKEHSLPVGFKGIGSLADGIERAHMQIGRVCRVLKPCALEYHLCAYKSPSFNSYTTRSPVHLLYRLKLIGWSEYIRCPYRTKYTTGRV